MASSVFNTLVSDTVVPAEYTGYIQELTEVKSKLIASGVLEKSQILDTFLAGGGLTINVPSWKDIADDADNVSTDATADKWGHILNGTSIDLSGALTVLSDSVPKAFGTAQEIAVRLSRNKSWAFADLAKTLSGSDPMEILAQRLSDYWARRLQDIFIATWKGVCKDNGVNDSGDYASSIIGASYVAGVTDFSAEAFIDALATTGDSEMAIDLVMMHSVVYNRAKKNNLIDFMPDSSNPLAQAIPTFLGRRVIVDDSMPNGTGSVTAAGVAGAAGCYETWMFGAGAMKFGVGSPPVPTAVTRQEQAGNGGGQTIVYSRKELCLHPVGHAFTVASPASGGPGNGTSTGNLNIATSWNRVYPERKQIHFCRLITRES